MTIPTRPTHTTPPKETLRNRVSAFLNNSSVLLIIAGWCLGVVSYPLLQRIADSFVVGNTRFNNILYDLVPETIGILFTVFILERFARQREEVREKEEIKQRIIREMSTRDNATARRAAREARERGLLEDGSLRQALLPEAKMEEVNLTGADLYGAMLWVADLSRAKLSRINLRDASLERSQLDDAYLYRGNLQNAFLVEADLARAMLDECNLQGANLKEANLEDADMHEVDLRGAFLVGANLSGAKLKNALFNENTILPDAQRQGRDENGNFIYDKHWSPEIDMQQYTNPRHREFWQPDYLKRGYKGREPYWRQKKMFQISTPTGLFLTEQISS